MSPGNEFLSRKIFILKRTNFRAEPFERKFGTNFCAFLDFLRECAEISTIKVYPYVTIFTNSINIFTSGTTVVE